MELHYENYRQQQTETRKFREPKGHGVALQELQAATDGDEEVQGAHISIFGARGQKEHVRSVVLCRISVHPLTINRSRNRDGMCCTHLM
jgi:hypothetical protein